MFALADCNNFYASCEELFNPKLTRTALIVLSNNDGIVIARSKKAKEMGIQMGAPAFLYKDQIERGEIRALSSNFTLYADMSARVMQVLESFAPLMEIYSIDEAFFELEDLPEKRIVEQSIQIREKVKKWTGIPVSIGIGPTKTIAKIANEFAKKQPSERGVCALLSPSAIQNRLEKTALDEIWGIGDALAQRLKAKRIYTAAELAACNDTFIQKLLGVTGYRTVLELRGISCFSCEETAEKRKSIVCSRSFKQPIADRNILEEAIATFTSRAAEKLREQNSRAQFMSIFISTNPFAKPYESASCHIDLPHPTDYTPDLIHFAKEGLDRIYRPPFAYKKAGIMLSCFHDGEIEQMDWITPSNASPKKEHLMRAIDQINRRYDKNVVHSAAEGGASSRTRPQANVSPKYTTSWTDLLIVR
jgi:DNA polymerase V